MKFDELLLACRSTKQEVDHDAAVDAVRAAYESGINVFDTSPYYGLTRSETARSSIVCILLGVDVSLDQLATPFFWHRGGAGARAGPQGSGHPTGQDYSG